MLASFLFDTDFSCFGQDLAPAPWGGRGVGVWESLARV